MKLIKYLFQFVDYEVHNIFQIGDYEVHNRFQIVGC